MDDRKDVNEIFDLLKDKVQPTEEQVDVLKNMAEKYSKKSNEEILFEIIKLNKKLSSEKKEEYKEKLKKLDQIRPLLNEEQQKKLDKVLEILLSEEE